MCELLCRCWKSNRPKQPVLPTMSLFFTVKKTWSISEVPFSIDFKHKYEKKKRSSGMKRNTQQQACGYLRETLTIWGFCGGDGSGHTWHHFLTSCLTTMFENRELRATLFKTVMRKHEHDCESLSRCKTFYIWAALDTWSHGAPAGLEPICLPLPSKQQE